ncbi:MAG: SIS domain-containing protein [Patescibacteria group bacterium]
MFDLDSLKAIEHLDRQRVSERLRALPEEIAAFIKTAEKIKKLKTWQHINRVVILGMGGSGIAGEIAKNIVDFEGSIPVTSIHDTSLPNYIDQQTLVIGVSFSGSTAETLISVKKAIEQGAPTVLICHEDSPLDILSIEHNLPVFHVTSPEPPRFATANLLVPILIILDRVGALSEVSKNLTTASSELTTLREQIKPTKITQENNAKQLATTLHGKIPLILSAPGISSTSLRFAQSMNENAKSYAFYYPVSEFAHNMIEAREKENPFYYVIVRSSFEDRFIDHAFTAIQKGLERDGIPYITVQLEGKTLLSQLLYGLSFFDYVSYYAALLKKENPHYIDNIEFYKKHLKK